MKNCRSIKKLTGIYESEVQFFSNFFNDSGHWVRIIIWFNNLFQIIQSGNDIFNNAESLAYKKTEPRKLDPDLLIILLIKLPHGFFRDVKRLNNNR